MEFFNINCIHFDRDTYKCNKVAKILGLFRRGCVCVPYFCTKCSLQEEYPEPDYLNHIPMPL